MINEIVKLTKADECYYKSNGYVIVKNKQHYFIKHAWLHTDRWINQIVNEVIECENKARIR